MSLTVPQQASASPLPEWITDKSYVPPPGTLGNLTMTQLHCMDKLKKELKEEGRFVEERMDDPTLLRFCRARKFVYADVKAMFIANEEWRTEFGVDEIVKNFEFKERAKVHAYYPQYYHKVDKDGRPLYIEQLGKFDLKALLAITTIERQVQNLVYEYEKSLSTRVKVCSHKAGHPVETFCTILDLGGVGISSFWAVKDIVSQFTSIGQNRYPETMGRFYIINAPWGFSTIWRVIKPWLDPVTVAKIEILGTTYTEELLKQIPIENLPKEFGGTCECVGGCSLSDAGPWDDPDAVAAAGLAAPAPTVTETVEVPAPATS